MINDGRTWAAMIWLIVAAALVAMTVGHFELLGDVKAHEAALRCHARGYGTMEECFRLLERPDLWNEAGWQDR